VSANANSAERILKLLREAVLPTAATCVPLVVQSDPLPERLTTLVASIIGKVVNPFPVRFTL